MKKIGMILFFCVVLSAGNGFASGQAAHEMMVENFSNSLRLFRQHVPSEGTPGKLRNLRDPMMPLVDQSGNLIKNQKQSKGFRLEGILYSEEGVVALINGELYAPGQSSSEYDVAEIRPEGITLQTKNKKEYVPVFPHEQESL